MADQAFDYSKIPEGSTYKAPDGTQRQKAYKVTNDEDHAKVPEGAPYIDPNGVRRIKPKYEGISANAQAIFDEAVNPKEQRNALAHFYGEQNIKEDPEGLYVQIEPGKRLRPGKGSLGTKANAFVQANVAPTLFAGMGTYGGGVLGAPLGPAGVAGGAFLGSGIGSAAGQGYNDLQLALMGVYDRTPAEEAHQLNEALTFGLGGELGGTVAGKAAAKTLGAAKNLPQAGAEALNKIKPVLRHWVTAEGEDFERAVELAKKGVPVPVKKWAKGAFMPKVIQDWAKMIPGYDPVKQAAETYYNVSAKNIMNALGITPEEAATRTTAQASSEKAGQAMLAKIRQEMAAADAELDRVYKEALRRTGVATDEEKASSVRDLQGAIDANEKVAQKAIDENFKDIDATRQKMIQTSKVGQMPGDLARSMADKLTSVNKAIKARARVLYQAADAAAGGRLPNIKPLTTEASRFHGSLPPGFDKKYPNEIKLIADMSKKDKSLTFGQLHQLRSFLRYGIDWQDLTPDFRQGALKNFQYLVNNVLHDSEAAPELKNAAAILDKTDQYYARNIAAFNDNKIQNIIDMTKSGLPPNPSVIAKMVMEQEGGWTERMTKLRKLAGPQIWQAVQAADLKNIMDSAKTLDPRQIDTKKFADEILKRYQTGVLENGYNKILSAKLLKQAQYIAMKGGKLDFKILPGDTVAEAVSRIAAAQSRIDAIVAKDPYSTLSSEVRKLEAAHKQRLNELKTQRSNEPLHFLNEPSALAIASADRILSSPDLLKAAAARFGPQSGEFTMLRQVAAQRILQRELMSSAHLSRDLSLDHTRDVQQILFPNGLDKAVHELGKDMALLVSQDSEGLGTSLAGAAVGFHPVAAVKRVVGKAAAHLVVGPDVFWRAVISDRLEWASNFFSSPKLILWFAGRSKPITNEEAKKLAQTAMNYAKYGGVAGAMAGAAAAPIDSQKPPKPVPVKQDWRSEYQKRYGK